MDEREIELIAYECAYLERHGWKYVGNGMWKQSDVHASHERRVAMGIQQIRDAEVRIKTSQSQSHVIAVIEPKKIK